MSQAVPSSFESTVMESDSTFAARSAQGAYGFLGRYRLDRLIGQGAMGAVYEAFDETLGRTLAIKTLHTALEGDGNNVYGGSKGLDTLGDGAILQEARAAATLNHPHIVTVYDAGRAHSQALGRDLPYVAMELLQGVDLRQHMARGRMGVREAVSLVGKLALALDHAHKSGVLHRDIKPANVFITHNGSPKILDFGLARVTARAKAKITRPAPLEHDVVAGSPQYMSPEHMRSIDDPLEVVDARSDIYSLGVVLYELLCGKPPFSAPTLALLQERIKLSTPAPPYKVNPIVPRALSDLVIRALAKKPLDRYRSAAQFARELRRWGQDAPDPAYDAVASATLPAALGATSVHGKAATLRKAAVAAMIAAAVFAAGLWWHHHNAADQSAAAVPPAPATATASEAGAAILPSRSDADATLTAPTVTPPATIAAARAETSAPPVNAAVTPAVNSPPASATNAPTSAAPPPGSEKSAVTGRVRLSIRPWGEVEVDGRKLGVSPPLLSVNLPPGEHTIVLRNADYAARTFRIQVEADKTERVTHVFR